MTFSDLALARRLERAEGRACADFVDARAAAMPGVGAQWVEVAGALALFDGAESPISQTFALGMLGGVSPDEMHRLETFFSERATPVQHEVSPLADASVFAQLYARRYQIVEFTSVMWQPIAPTAARPGSVTVRPIEPDEHDVWAQTAARGWSHVPEIAPFLNELGQVNRHRRNHVPFMAFKDAQPIAAGGLAIVDGVALLAGASTVPSARKQGAQLALLDARLRYAADCGCDLAMMGALPGSDSQRNAERQGFRIAYTRIKWKKPSGV